jgi:5-methylcytosine-specific restriction enzyme A
MTGWNKTPSDRQRDNDTYGPEYRANAATCKRNAHGRCARCGQLSHPLQADHITPVSQGGTHQITNLQALCTPCHRAKTAREGSKKQAPITDPPAQPTTRW